MAGLDNATWAGCLKASSVASLDSLRLCRELEGCLTGDFLWIRGNLTEALQKLINCVPWQRTYEVLPGGKLRARESFLPEGRLPAGPWRSLMDLLKPEMPMPLLPGQRKERIELSWHTAAEEKPLALLLTTAEHWLAFVSEAPEVRLKPLRFVQNGFGQILVQGNPLPSIPGWYFSMEDGIAIPAGKQVIPQLSSHTIRTTLGLAGGEIALLLEEGTFSGIPSHAWMQASPATVRINSISPSYGSA